jgi:hypothetical protein
MLDNNITILQGDRASGRTTFLLEILSTLLSLDKNILFLDILGESEYYSIIHRSRQLGNPKNLHYHKFNSPRVSNNMMFIDVIIEKIKGYKIDYLFIDDLEFNDISLIKKLVSITNCKIILTSSETSDINKVIYEGKSFFRFFKKGFDYKIYYVTSKYVDDDFTTNFRITSDGVGWDKDEIKSVILSRFREIKIDTILEE